eukprot:GHVL01008805.1.p3 GENE.GHVL01008805.1~~GHVL01008805.1.p3  ORF type:complete len:163 (-),score=18.81 GHVL01008805.1:469-957(-)
MLYDTWKNIDISHTIHHLSFGDAKDVQDVQNYFENHGMIHPLDGIVKTIPDTGDDEDPIIFEYYLKIVPSIFRKLSSVEHRVHQFTASSNRIRNPQMPSIYFRFDILPVTVLFAETKNSLLSFVIDICAILGGVFTMAGILDALVYRGVNEIMKKFEMGKLG